jgi:hypothetical protein
LVDAKGEGLCAGEEEYVASDEDSEGEGETLGETLGEGVLEILGLDIDRRADLDVDGEEDSFEEELGDTVLVGVGISKDVTVRCMPVPTVEPSVVNKKLIGGVKESWKSVRAPDPM